MPYSRARTSRRFSSTAPKPRYQWARTSFYALTNLAPGVPYTFDLLATFKNSFGISFNLPEITIWRIHIKLSCRITVTAPQANDGVFTSAWVDTFDQVQLVSSAVPYDQKYLIWDQFFCEEQILQSGIATANSYYREFDVKSHRRLESLNDTLIGQLVGTGTTTIVDASVQAAVLLRLPH